MIGFEVKVEEGEEGVLEEKKTLKVGVAVRRSRGDSSPTLRTKAAARGRQWVRERGVR